MNTINDRLQNKHCPTIRDVRSNKQKNKTTYIRLTIKL